MFFGLLELILLLLSGSTFVFAVCLMTWIIFKTNFIQSIWREKRGEYQLEKKPDSRGKDDEENCIYYEFAFFNRHKLYSHR